MQREIRKGRGGRGMAASGDDEVVKQSKTIKGFKYLQIHQMRDEDGGG